MTQSNPKQRNPEAVCGTCPYFVSELSDDKRGYCYRYPHHIGEESPIPDGCAACGEHPDFFKEIDQ